MIFQRHAVIGIDLIYSTYGNIHSVPEMRHVIDELFLTLSHLASVLDIIVILLFFYYSILL